MLESGEEGEPGATACAMTGHEVSPTAELSLSAQPRSVLGERDKAGVHPCWEEGALEVECPPPRGRWALRPACMAPDTSPDPSAPQA